jgi:hypothetical protein
MKKNEKQAIMRSNAQAAGERILANKTAIKKLQKSIDDDMIIVRNWANSTGETTLGNVLIYERKSPPKLISADGSSANTEEISSKLVFELPFQYTRRTVEVALMLNHIETDENLKKVLEKHKLNILQESTWQIKHL